MSSLSLLWLSRGGVDFLHRSDRCLYSVHMVPRDRFPEAVPGDFTIKTVSVKSNMTYVIPIGNTYNGGSTIIRYSLLQSPFDLNFRIWETPSVIPNPPVSTPLSAIPLVIMLACLAAIIFYRLI